jgi:hypothetical protein
MKIKKIRLGLAVLIAASVLMSSHSFAARQQTIVQPATDAIKLCVVIKGVKICVEL